MQLRQITKATQTCFSHLITGTVTVTVTCTNFCDIDIYYCFVWSPPINMLFCFYYFILFLTLYNYMCCLVNAKIKYFSLSLSLSKQLT